MSRIVTALAFILIDALVLVLILPILKTGSNGAITIFEIVAGCFLCLLIFSKPFIGMVVIIAALPIQGLYPNIPIGTSILSVIGFVTFASVMIKTRFSSNIKIELEPIYVWSIAFLIWLIISDPSNSIQGRNWIFTYAQLIILMWLAPRLLDRRRQHQLMFWYIIVCVASSIIGITQGQLTSSIYTTIRADGLTGNANEYAMYLVFAVCLSIYFVTSIKKYFAVQIIMFACIIILILGVVFSASRTGAIALGVTIICTFLFYSKLSWVRNTATKTRRLSGLIMFIVVLGLSAVFFIPPEYWSILGEAQNLLQLGSQANRGTVVERLDFWQEAIDLWKAAPLQGIGAGQAVGYIDHVIHNMYLTVLVEQGLIGFIFYILWLANILYNLVRVSLKSPNPQDVALATSWLLVFISILIFGVTNSFQYLKFPWLVAGISLTFSRHSGSHVNVNGSWTPRLALKSTVLRN